MRVLHVLLIAAVLWLPGTGSARGQAAATPEVRQIVTFSFQPGKTAEAMALFRDQALPLYEADTSMLTFRAFREVESPRPLDLMVVSTFAGMAGMDRSNASLRELAAAAGSSIGAIYGGIAALSTGHTDQFVEMLPALGTGDPSAQRLTAFIWYQVAPGQGEAFEAALEATVAPWEQAAGIASATGRFLLSDGWHYLRMVGFRALGAYQQYWHDLARQPGYDRVPAVTVRRSEVIVAAVQALSVR